MDTPLRGYAVCSERLVPRAVLYHTTLRHAPRQIGPRGQARLWYKQPPARRKRLAQRVVSRFDFGSPARRGTGTTKALDSVKRPIRIPPHRWRSVQQPLGNVAVGLLEIGKAADVQPVLADQIRSHQTLAIENHPDHVRGIEVLAGRDERDGRWIEEIDAGIDGELFAGLLLDAGHAITVEGELAVGNFHLVSGDTDGHRRLPLAPVKLPHRTEIALGQDIRIDDEEGLREPVAEEGQDAHGAERGGLEH